MPQRVRRELAGTRLAECSVQDGTRGHARDRQSIHGIHARSTRMRMVRSSFRTRRSRRYLHGFTALGWGAMALGCSAAGPKPVGTGDTIESGGETISQTRQALDYCPNPVNCTQVTSLDIVVDTSGSASQLIGVAKDFGNAVEGLFS